MCGLVGYWTRKSGTQQAMDVQIERMALTLLHRGPDDAGFWSDPGVGIALGFRRLAIIDLSPEGHQPMFSESGRYVATYNGEVYNFAELRLELEARGHRFRGHSDTEVMLAAVEEWGLEAAVGRFVGMFALVVWDRQERQLSLVRDRLGIKPMYYGWMGDTFMWGSELKALRQHPDFRVNVNRGALTLFMRNGYIPSPYSIYEDIHQLTPGSILTLDFPLHRSVPARYWSGARVAENGMAHPFMGTEDEAIRELDESLRRAVGLRMVADVPLGAFLSGGVDSSTVVSLMQAQSMKPVKTFSIGFAEEQYNEARYAGEVARHLGTDHHELYVTPKDALDVIPLLPEMYDEPFADSSQIPTYLVSRLTRQHVTVSLSGDGGDELFGGYTRFFTASDIWGKIGRFPKPARRAAAAVIGGVPVSTYDRWLGWAGSRARRYGVQGSVGHKFQRLAEVLREDSAESMYTGLLSHTRRPSEVVLAGFEPATTLLDRTAWANVGGLPNRMMAVDLVTYLPDDILVKVDRASMAVSLEARVPLLDHRVVELAWRLPLDMKIRHGNGKWILRQVLYRYVPKELIERPKMGFGVPIDVWLRGPLREWAESLLDEQRLRGEGFLNPDFVRAVWQEHLSGRRNRQGILWNILMFQSWQDRWVSRGPQVVPDLQPANAIP